MVLTIYATMMPLILTGIVNMIFTKTPLYNKYKKPIDNGKVLKDGKRLFGNNKTYIGFLSMIVFYVVFQVIWGLLSLREPLLSLNTTYIVHSNTLIFNILTGIIFGFTYMICELPNSFIKRRIDIESGKTAKGLKGVIFFVIDQIDSLIGVFLVLKILNGMSWVDYLMYLLVGAGTHIGINLVLYWLRIRRDV